MSVKIYRYSNPYTLGNEAFWTKGENKLYLCASVAIRDGLRDLDINKDRLVLTISEFLNFYYYEWENNPVSFIDQYIEVGGNREEVSFKFSKESIVKALRMLMEFGVKPSELEESLTVENQEIYEQINFKEVYEEFYYSNLVDLNPTDCGKGKISKAIKYWSENVQQGNKVKNISINEIYIFGLHRFTPIIINFLNHCVQSNITLSFIHNYLEEYTEIYSTWLRVYENIEVNEINDAMEAYTFEESRYYHIADTFEELSGNKNLSHIINDVNMMEFENGFRFRNYVESHIQTYYLASKESQKLITFDKKKTKGFIVNYIGRIISSLYNIVDYERNDIIIKCDMEILKNLAFYYDYIEDSNYYDNLSRLEFYLKGTIELKEARGDICKLIDNINSVKSPGFDKFEFWMDIEELTGILNFIDIIINNCNRIFQVNDGNLLIEDSYYNTLQIIDELAYKSKGNIDKDELNIIKTRIELAYESDIEECSLEDLTYSIGYYLNPYLEDSDDENTCIKGIEEIEGGIWREKGIIHIGALSDSNINKINEASIPWPLTKEMILRLNNSNQKFTTKLYIDAMEEYYNFNRYCLFYALIYARNKVNLSYIKKINNKENKPYYLFRLLNLVELYEEEIDLDFDLDLVLFSEPAFDIDESDLVLYGCESWMDNELGLQSDHDLEYNPHKEDMEFYHNEDLFIDDFNFTKKDFALFEFCPHRFYLEKIILRNQKVPFIGGYNNIRYCERIIFRYTVEWCHVKTRLKAEIASYVGKLCTRLDNIIPGIYKNVDLFDLGNKCMEYIFNKYRVSDGYHVKILPESWTYDFMRIVYKDKKLYELYDTENKILNYINDIGSIEEKSHNSRCVDCPMGYVCMKRFLSEDIN